MKKKSVPIWLLRMFLPAILLGCLNKPARQLNSTDIVTPTSAIAAPTFNCDYETQKIKCRNIFQLYKQSPVEVNRKKLIQFFADSLLPCWYGTPWDFNGTTRTPQKGAIACGYFVTTTLQDAGMKIDRVKMAQCASEQLVRTNCSGLKRFSNVSLDDFVQSVRKMGFGLYITGLDNHTGFILNDGRDVYFIHSGVYAPRCALKEKAIGSVTLRKSNYRIIGRVEFQ
ncbi:MAG: hypothetical protein NTW29_05745 [Bacteroidetes bacterium]|nr:hypothetical protein [Bacteroidota bacterium]